MEPIFTQIYESNSWASHFNSGSGSTFENTVEYRAFLKDFLTLSGIQTVADLGCGNWDFYHEEFDPVVYTGYDCVEKVIQINRDRHGQTDRRRFVHRDLSSADFTLPEKVDLIILKDVLQHVSNSTIARILQKIVQLARYILIVNDVHWGDRETDCKDGGHRTLSTMAPPFTNYPIRPVMITRNKLVSFIRGEGSEWKNLIYSRLAQVNLSERVLIAILARNKAYCLEKYLECLTNLDYPKSQIVIYINTNNNVDRTLNILQDWRAQHVHEYASIILEDHHSKELEGESNQPHDWTPTKFNVLGQIRDRSLSKTLEMGCHYYLVVDCDNFITNPYTLKELILARKPIIGPMIRQMTKNVFYANYWTGIDHRWFYLSGPQYYEILDWKHKGIHRTKVTHCAYLIDATVIPQLSYTQNELPGGNNYEFARFSRSATEHNIGQYICNQQFYGFIHFAKDQSTLQTEAIDKDFIEKVIH